MIALRQAVLGYPGKEVIRGLSLTLPEKGAVALMAPSGFGKTTLLRTLAGLTPLLSGRMTGLDGLQVAFLFQEDRLLPWATARQNVALAGDGETADYWLAQMEISQPDAWPREMSGGMQRRVALARALT
ncbi:MAG: ATP-binding cassette domain-containing protein, partial [Eubacteriales bacterium]|nr:ATP-binding cassette domain-containing protein [Eubacteriales bacterium]